MEAEMMKQTPPVGWTWKDKERVGKAIRVIMPTLGDLKQKRQWSLKGAY